MAETYMLKGHGDRWIFTDGQVIDERDGSHRAFHVPTTLNEDSTNLSNETIHNVVKQARNITGAESLTAIQTSGTLKEGTIQGEIFLYQDN